MRLTQIEAECYAGAKPDETRPFGEDSAMGYYEVPADVVEDVAQLETWVKRAIDVAASAKGGKHKRSKRV